MPIIKQICLLSGVVALSFMGIREFAHAAIDAWDRAYEGERQMIAEYRSLAWFSDPKTAEQNVTDNDEENY